MRASDTWLYSRWHRIKIRATPAFWVGKEAYIGTSIHEDFATFQGFEAWALNQVGAIPEWHIDKDILVRGNRVYGPDTCVFVPPEINQLVNGSKGARGSLPIGVGRTRGSAKFKASCSIDGKLKCLYGFQSVEDAFDAYKALKEANIKHVAEKWKLQIDERVYAALMAWEIKITD